MRSHLTRRHFVGIAAAATAVPLFRRTALAEPSRDRSLDVRAPEQHSLDSDLPEITIPRLRALYEARKYSAAEVTRWYLDRIARYDHVYRALLHVDTRGALATATAEDTAARAGGPRFRRGPLWGVPIVIKANTSVKGLVTSAGWSGYLIPGYELIAPKDAPIVAKLRAAGAIILGQTNMPDFAASDASISSAFGRTGNAYDWRFSPGGSSGGTVTSVAGNFCVFGNGTDTANSIRMPAATSSLVGLLPTRGLVSIAGINPLNWLLDNTGPITRTVTDAAIALDVMAGEDPQDFRTKGSAELAEPGPYSKYLHVGALSGKRFGVPAFFLNEPAGGDAGTPLQPDTRELFLKALDGLRSAGATVVIDDAILPESFLALGRAMNTRPYLDEGLDDFLRDYGPPQYHSAAEYAIAVGSPIPASVRGQTAAVQPGQAPAPPPRVESGPQAEQNVWAPQRTALAAYDEALDRFHLDGFVYPAIQMPPNDELAPLAQGNRSSGPHSRTGWVNQIGVPAISIPGGFYPSGLPFGLEMSTRRWKDGDLLGWAFAYEQATKFRRPPVLVEKRQ